MTEIDANTRTELEAAAFRTLVQHLRDHPEELRAITPLEPLLAAPRTQLPDGATLHVVIRDRPYATPFLEALQETLRTDYDGPPRLDIRYLRLR